MINQETTVNILALVLSIAFVAMIITSEIRRVNEIQCQRLVIEYNADHTPIGKAIFLSELEHDQCPIVPVVSDPKGE